MTLKYPKLVSSISDYGNENFDFNNLFHDKIKKDMDLDDNGVYI